MVRAVAGAGADEVRRRRILAHVGDLLTLSDAEDVIHGICRFAVDELALSGCAVMLMTDSSTSDVLAAAGPRAGDAAELQFALGEGPCLDSYTTGSPVYAVDLATRGARWPTFAPAAAELGILSEFSFPLRVGGDGIGTLDLSRSSSGMLSDEQLADALVVADITTDAVLMLQSAADGIDLSRLLSTDGGDRLVVHQASGMVAVQLDASPVDALASLRAAAYRGERSIYEVAVDVVDRQVTFRE